ncbi:MAG: hypothetical protein ACFFCS_29870, partial [Candidatus Hodarchaeota archaeon]
MTELIFGIHQLWLMDNASGICFFEQEFSDVDLPPDIDPCLFGGFFTALLTFSKRITNEKLRFIQLQTMRFYFHNTPKVLYVLATSDRVKVQHVTVFLSDIQSQFEAKYQNILESEEFNEARLFRNFAVDIEQIIGKESRIVNFIGEDSKFGKQQYQTAKVEYNKLKQMLFDQTSQFQSHQKHIFDEFMSQGSNKDNKRLFSKFYGK